VSSGGEGFFPGCGSALCQGAAAAKRFCLIHDLEARFSVSCCAGQHGWPAVLTTPGDSGRRTRVKGPGGCK